MRRALARGLVALPLAAAVLAACESATTLTNEGKVTPKTPVPAVRASLLTGMSAMSHFQVCSVGGAATYTFTATNYPDVTSGQMTGSMTIAAGDCQVIYTTNVHGLSTQNPVTVTMTNPTTPNVQLTSIVGHLLFYHCTSINPLVCQTDDTPTTFTNTTSVTYNVNGDIGAQADFEFTPLPPSLTVTKTADAASVNAGSDIGFNITVTSGGPGTATGVTLTDVLPSGTGLSWSINPSNAACSITAGTLTCNFGDMAASAVASVHLTSPTSAGSCGVYNNTASAASSNGATGQGSASETVVCPPSLTLTKTADAATVSGGSPIGFTLTVTSTGPGTAHNVTLTDALPLGTGVSWSMSPANGACTISAGTLSCSFGDLAPAASISVHVTSPTTAQSCGTYANTAYAEATGVAQLTASAITTVSCSCGTLTIGYWKTHAGFGPQADAVTPLLPQWLGTPGGALSVKVTTAAQAVTLLGMNGKASNPVNKLYAQLLGAKLNMASGTDGSAVASVVSAADAFLATHNENSSLTSTEKSQVLSWMTTLDNYNSGIIGPGHCS